MEKISQTLASQFPNAGSGPSRTSRPASPVSATDSLPNSADIHAVPPAQHRVTKQHGRWICCGRAMLMSGCEYPWHLYATCSKTGDITRVPDYPTEASDPFAQDAPRACLNGYQDYRLRRNWQRDNLGTRYQNGLWSKCQMGEVIREWHHTPDVGLLVSGDKGTGKTVASGLMMTCLAARNEFSFAWWNISALLGALHSWRNWGVDFAQDEALKYLRECRYLFLDDLGVEYNSPLAMSRFNELVETRYARELVTVATSNLSRDRLIEREGWERIVDRLQDGILDWCELGGESMRRPR